MPKEPQVHTPKGRGIYLLPNLFTTGTLFAGFYAIVAAMRGDFDLAAISIYIAMLMDGLDGRVARLTNTQSAFGAEYDSLSDMVAFGVAPALVVYSWSLSSIGKIGWLAAFLYAAAGALRLARFNTQIAQADKRFFQGLPIPAAAAVIAGLVWVGSNYDYYGAQIGPVAALLTVAIALLMVSKIRYHSFKQIDFRGKIPFITLFAIVLIFVCVSIDPPQVLFFCFTLYALYGVLETMFCWRRVHKRRKMK